MSRRTIVPTLATSVVLIGVIAFSAVRRDDVALGEIALEGGTLPKTVDTAAIPSGTNMTATIKNAIKTPGSTITDVTVTVRRVGGTGNPPPAAPDIGDVTIGNQSGKPGPTSEKDGEAATVSNLSIPAPNGTASCTIPVNSPGGTAEVKVSFTPSVSDKPKGTLAEACYMSGFELSGTADGARHSIAENFHDRFAAGVFNVDSQSNLAALSGTVLIPAGANVALSAVHLQDPNDDFAPVSGATISIHSSQFTITGLELAPAHCYELVVVLSGAMNGKNVKLQLDATFE